MNIHRRIHVKPRILVKKGGKESLIIEFFVILQMIVDYRQHLIVKNSKNKINH